MAQDIDSLRQMLSLDTLKGTQRIAVLTQLGRSLSKNSPSEAAGYYYEAMDLADELNLKNERIKPMNFLGALFNDQGQYLQAGDLFFITANEALEVRDTVELLRSYMGLGEMFTQTKDFVKGIEHFKNALQLAKATNNQKWIAAAHVNLGGAFNYSGDNKSALSNYYAAEKIFTQQGNDSGLSMLYNNIGVIYDGQGQYEMALTYLNKSAQIAFSKKDNTVFINLCYVNYADLYIKMKKPDSAFFWALKGAELAKKNKSPYHLMLSKKHLADANALVGKYDDAFKYLKEYNFLKDSLFNDEKVKRIQKMNENYELGKKENEISKKQLEIDLLAQTAKVRELELSRERNLKYVFMVGTLLLVLIVAITFYGFRIKTKLSRLLADKYEKIQKQKEIIESINKDLKVRALRATMNPHFIFNALNSIQYLIINNYSDQAFAYLSKFSVLLRKVLENADKTAIPMAEELEMLELYIELEALRFDDNFQYKIESSEQVKKCFIPPMLIQPFVENAIVHGLLNKPCNRKLDIKLSIEKMKIICQVMDNGIGRPAAKKLKAQKPNLFSSVGMKLTEMQLEVRNTLNKGNSALIVDDLIDESGQPAGTRVTITLDNVN